MTDKTKILVSLPDDLIAELDEMKQLDFYSSRSHVIAAICAHFIIKNKILEQKENIMFDATFVNASTWDKCFPCRRRTTESQKNREILTAAKITEPFEVQIDGGKIPGNAGDVLIINITGQKWIVSPEFFKQHYDILGGHKIDD